PGGREMVSARRDVVGGGLGVSSPSAIELRLRERGPRALDVDGDAHAAGVSVTALEQEILEREQSTGIEQHAAEVAGIHLRHQIAIDLTTILRRERVDPVA